MRNFLWSEVGEEKMDPLVNWETCCLLISSSRLGIRNLRSKNFPLLAKWLLCFLQESSSLRHKVIKSIYGH